MSKSNQELQDKIAQLSPRERLILESKIVGFQELPPTIDEFLDNEYYIGGLLKIYPKWREILREIYPDEIHTSCNFIIFSSALGVGKSTIANVMSLYTLCRLTHMKNLEFSGIDLEKAIVFQYFHASVDRAVTDFITPENKIMKKSPYFSKPVNKIQHIMVPDCTRSQNKILGSNLLFSVFSELNFTDPEKSYKRLKISSNRYNSRFAKLAPYIGNIVIDSSPGTDSALVERFIKETAFKIKVYRPYPWEIKGHLGIYSKETFEVYQGDSVRTPYVVSAEKPKDPLADSDLYIKVPLNLKPFFEMDCELALQDHCGIVTKSTTTYVKNPKKIQEGLILPKLTADEISVKFFDENEQIIDYVREAVEALPDDRRIYIGLDAGVVSDRFGISLGYYSGPFIESPEDLKIIKPTFEVPISFVVSREKFEETSFNKIFRFIIEVSKLKHLEAVIMDTYQSKNLEQDLKREKIRCWYLSTDRTSVPFDYVKMSFYENRVKGVKSELLYEEWINLKLINGRVDHDNTHTKDDSDAFVRCIYGVFRDLKTACKLSRNYQSIITQEMLKNIYANERNDVIAKATHSFFKSEEDKEL